MKVFFYNIKRYFPYSIYSARCSVKAGIAGSTLQFLWLILEPFLMMMVYAFISIIVFNSKEPHFVVMVFIGQGTWSFINRCITDSITLVKGNKSIVSRVYIPKYMLMISAIAENLFHYGISILLTLLVAVPFGVTLTWKIVFLFLIVAEMCVITFGFGCILLHIGVYLKDTRKIMRVFMRLLFYMSGIFFSIPSRVPKPFNNILLCFNPAAMLINETRQVIIYGRIPHMLLLGVWFVFGLLLSIIGVGLIHRYEQNYVKAI